MPKIGLQIRLWRDNTTTSSNNEDDNNDNEKMPEIIKSSISLENWKQMFLLGSSWG